MKESTRFAFLVVVAVAIEAFLIAMPPSLSALDARLFYGADEARAFLRQLGLRGRTEYFVHESIDLGFIVAYTLLLRALAERWRLPGSVGWMIYAPGAADLLETTGILTLLALYPSEPRLLAGAIGYFTLIKWAGLILVTIALQIARLVDRRGDGGAGVVLRDRLGRWTGRRSREPSSDPP